MMNYDISKASVYWFKEDKSSIHSAVFGTASQILENQKFRRANNVSLLGLYSRRHPGGNLQGTVEPYNQSMRLRHIPYIGVNVIHNLCQAATSKITKNRPRPMFLTEGGEYSQKKKAKQLQKFVEGLFYMSDAYEKGAQAFLDCTIFDIGGLKVYEDGKNIHVERVYPNEIFIDDADAFYGKPSQLYQHKRVPREVLLGQYPNKKEAIITAGDNLDSEEKERTTLADMVSVVEAWALPQGKLKGRHVICTDTGVLLDEEYKDTDFPFVFIRWSDRGFGFYGTSLTELLQGLQLELEKVTSEIQMSLHLCSKPIWLVEKGSKVNKHHFNNDVGTIQEYSGTPPQMFTPNPVSEQLFKHLEWVYNKMFEVTGISQLSAQSRKPPGLNSGVALQEFHDIESERFYLVGKAYEQLFMNLAEKMVDCAKRIYEREGKFEVKLAGRNSMETIDWADIDMAEDSYVMKVYPTSFLPSTPAGKLQYLQELAKLQIISPEDMREQLEYPDVKAWSKYANADKHVIEMLLEDMLDPEDPQYRPFEPFMNPEMAMKMAREAYIVAYREGAEEENLELLRRFMAEVATALAPPEPPAAPEAAPSAAPPGVEPPPPGGDTSGIV